ncbi:MULTISPECIES: hypothetical protein [unclassified Dolichospermum]|jgi:hypothetical protein|uniref:hypothetical protein n=1 Tax=unclassified Dolichospermum TaxID=2622029 RepID=UPI00144781FE|nr:MULTISPECIES: hypothetical protein [unclassified Dolichospermum]MTJ17466.1 hypothetical protein [Dolichospermum sp. UHCC 0299]MTJ41425.1 hypothetical protein [Dolichospermum sp. UHCC 0406]
MFYQAPEMKGSIRNLRQYYHEPMRQKVWSYELYLDDVLVKKQDCHWWSNTREEAIAAIKKIGEQIRKDELVKHELATVGDRLYIKWSTDITREGKRQGLAGYYGIFVKGRGYCAFSTQNLDEALAKLREIEIRNANDVEEFKRIRREIGY